MVAKLQLTGPLSSVLLFLDGNSLGDVSEASTDRGVYRRKL
jgi:hypothetical protein